MRVVAIGGGTGLAATLRAVRTYASDVTAVASVADDGGSSGRLRETLGIPAPGDLRKCIVALAEAGSVWAGALEHRFEVGELAGHPIGNVMIAGLTAVTGDFVAALDEVARCAGVAGRVLPATAEPVVLKAAVDGRADVRGQVAVQNAGRIVSIELVPADPPAPRQVVDAIDRADQVVLGPGSLYTSVLAAAAVPDVRAALASTAGRRVYVSNLREEVPETEGYDVAAHVHALRRHGVDVDVVVADVHAAVGALPSDGPALVVAPVAAADGLGHDPERLADVLGALSRVRAPE